MKRIGFIGFGEAAYWMSKGLKGEGYDKISAYDIAVNTPGNSKDIVFPLQEKTAQLNVELKNNLPELVNGSDIIISAVPAAAAWSVAQLAFPHLIKSQIFVDVTTAAPRVKKKVSNQFLSRNVLYVDAAMMGSLPVFLHKVPIFAAGNGAGCFKEYMESYGMCIRLVSNEPGKATEIKYIRSIFMKGLEALCIETFMAAKKSGIEDEILDSLAETLNKGDFKSTATRLLIGDALHAGRRYHEVKESGALLDEMGIEPIMARAIYERLKWSASLELKKDLDGKEPKELADIFMLWEKKGIV